MCRWRQLLTCTINQCKPQPGSYGNNQTVYNIQSLFSMNHSRFCIIQVQGNILYKGEENYIKAYLCCTTRNQLGLDDKI